MVYPYHSPPPPSPPPPGCNMTKPKPLPPPPPPICNMSSPPTPPPPPPKRYYNCTPKPPPCYYNCTPGVSPVSPPDGGGKHTVYIAVFVSLGGVFFLAFLAAGLFCLAKKRRRSVHVPVPGPVCVEGHEHIRETVTTTTGPSGQQVVTRTVDDDIEAREVLVGNEPSATDHGHGHHNG